MTTVYTLRKCLTDWTINSFGVKYGPYNNVVYGAITSDRGSFILTRASTPLEALTIQIDDDPLAAEAAAHGEMNNSAL